LPIPSLLRPTAIRRFRARKIVEVTEVARRKSQIRVAEEHRVGERAWKRASKKESETMAGGGVSERRWASN